MTNLLPEDINDLKSAMALLTREELEVFALDRAIRLNATSTLLSPKLEEQYNEILSETPLPEEELEEMNRVMEIVKSQIDLG